MLESTVRGWRLRIVPCVGKVRIVILWERVPRTHARDVNVESIVILSEQLLRTHARRVMLESTILILEQRDLSGAIIVGGVRIVVLWEQVLETRVSTVLGARIKMVTGPPVWTNAYNVWLESSVIGMEHILSAHVRIVGLEPGVRRLEQDLRIANHVWLERMVMRRDWIILINVNHVRLELTVEILG
jgi:hypothetical protein